MCLLREFFYLWPQDSQDLGNGSQADMHLVPGIFDQKDHLFFGGGLA